MGVMIQFKLTTIFQMEYKVQATPTHDIPTLEHAGQRICLAVKKDGKSSTYVTLAKYIIHNYSIMI